MWFKKKPPVKSIDEQSAELDRLAAEDPDVRTLVVENARFVLTLNEQSVMHVQQELAALYKWLMASLLTLNAGGLVTIASAYKPGTRLNVGDVVPFFTGGAALAVITGLIGGLGYLFNAFQLGEQIPTWRNVTITGQGLIGASAKAKKGLYKILLITATACVSALASLWCFAMGALSLLP